MNGTLNSLASTGKKNKKISSTLYSLLHMVVLLYYVNLYCIIRVNIIKEININMIQLINYVKILNSNSTCLLFVLHE